MTLRTLMQAGPAKANELFARLSETSEGAAKTRQKLFAELKAELELHTSLEEQHLFPVLRRNSETRALVSEAIKDNKELRAKLAELDDLPKTDDAFPERLKELQKAFRQHARDEKRELLPAVQRALSEEQLQGVVEKIEASVAEAEQAKQDELEERRLKARREREQAEQAKQAELEERRVKARQARERAEQQEGAERVQESGRRPVRSAADTAVAAPASALRTTEDTRRVGVKVYGVATDAYVNSLRMTVPDARAVAAEIPLRWMDSINQMALAGPRMSQELLWQSAMQQRRLAANAVQAWVEFNANVMRTTIDMAQRAFACSPKGSQR
jgi:iron-sulfur cluster repair protein YtfE (RIC family)